MRLWYSVIVGGIDITDAVEIPDNVLVQALTADGKPCYNIPVIQISVLLPALGELYGLNDKYILDAARVSVELNIPGSKVAFTMAINKHAYKTLHTFNDVLQLELVSKAWLNRETVPITPRIIDFMNENYHTIGNAALQGYEYLPARSNYPGLDNSPQLAGMLGPLVRDKYPVYGLLENNGRTYQSYQNKIYYYNDYPRLTYDDYGTPGPYVNNDKLDIIKLFPRGNHKISICTPNWNKLTWPDDYGDVPVGGLAYHETDAEVGVNPKGVYAFPYFMSGKRVLKSGEVWCAHCERDSDYSAGPSYSNYGYFTRNQVIGCYLPQFRDEYKLFTAKRGPDEEGGPLPVALTYRPRSFLSPNLDDFIGTGEAPGFPYLYWYFRASPDGLASWGARDFRKTGYANNVLITRPSAITAAYDDSEEYTNYTRPSIKAYRVHRKQYYHEDEWDEEAQKYDIYNSEEGVLSPQEYECVGDLPLTISEPGYYSFIAQGAEYKLNRLQHPVNTGPGWEEEPAGLMGLSQAKVCPFSITIEHIDRLSHINHAVEVPPNYLCVIGGSYSDSNYNKAWALNHATRYNLAFICVYDCTDAHFANIIDPKPWIMPPYQIVDPLIHYDSNDELLCVYNYLYELPRGTRWSVASGHKHPTDTVGLVRIFRPQEEPIPQNYYQLAGDMNVYGDELVSDNTLARLIKEQNNYTPTAISETDKGYLIGVKHSTTQSEEVPLRVLEVGWYKNTIYDSIRYYKRGFVCTAGDVKQHLKEGDYIYIYVPPYKRYKGQAGQLLRSYPVRHRITKIEYEPEIDGTIRHGKTYITIDPPPDRHDATASSSPAPLATQENALQFWNADRYFYEGKFEPPRIMEGAAYSEAKIFRVLPRLPARAEVWYIERVELTNRPDKYKGSIPIANKYIFTHRGVNLEPLTVKVSSAWDTAVMAYTATLPNPLISDESDIEITHDDKAVRFTLLPLDREGNRKIQVDRAYQNLEVKYDVYLDGELMPIGKLERRPEGALDAVWYKGRIIRLEGTPFYDKHAEPVGGAELGPLLTDPVEYSGSTPNNNYLSKIFLANGNVSPVLVARCDIPLFGPGQYADKTFINDLLDTISRAAGRVVIGGDTVIPYTMETLTATVDIPSSSILEWQYQGDYTHKRRFALSWGEGHKYYPGRTVGTAEKREELSAGAMINKGDVINLYNALYVLQYSGEPRLAVKLDPASLDDLTFSLLKIGAVCRINLAVAGIAGGWVKAIITQADVKSEGYIVLTMILLPKEIK